MLKEDLLTGKRLRLARLSEDEYTTMLEWESDTAFMRLFDSRPAYPSTFAEFKKFMEEAATGGKAYIFGAHLLEDNRLIGYIDISGIEWTHQVGWAAVAIGRAEDRGQGYGTEMMELLLDFCFRELNLHRVQLTVFGYNTGAQAMYEKLGFRHEGIFREFLHRDGQRWDMHLYGLLAREWRAA